MHGFFTTFKISNQKIILKFLTIKNEEEYSLREEPIFATIIYLSLYIKLEEERV